MDCYWVRMPAPTRPPGRSPLARSMLRRESPRCQEFAQDLPTQNVRWWTAERQEFLRKRRMRRGKSESTLLTLRWTRLPKLDSGSGRDATVLDGPFRRGSHGALVGIILLGRDHSFRSRQPRGTGWDTSLAVRGLSRGEPLLPRAVRGADYARGPRPVGVVGHLFRVLLGGEDPRAARARAACCVRCGKQFLSWIRACPNCGLARGAASDEFRELEITERNVCRLVRQGDLDEETADRLLPCLARP